MGYLDRVIPVIVKNEVPLTAGECVSFARRAAPPLEFFCPFCGEQLEQGEEMCKRCGTRIVWGPLM